MKNVWRIINSPWVILPVTELRMDQKIPGKVATRWTCRTKWFIIPLCHDTRPKLITNIKISIYFYQIDILTTLEYRQFWSLRKNQILPPWWTIWEPEKEKIKKIIGLLLKNIYPLKRNVNNFASGWWITLNFIKLKGIYA